jgi:hypothetical protein
MSTRFEILKNGVRVCIAGSNGDGVLSVDLSFIKHAGRKPKHQFSVGGLGMFDGSLDRPHHVNWSAPTVTTGDEITIRVLPPGEFDSPHGTTASPKKTVNDPELGRLDYYVDAWLADIELASPPLRTARVRIRASEQGPTVAQRKLLRDLPALHVRLWPEISTAIVRCHPDITTAEELLKRIVPHVGIDIGNELNRVLISYSLADDPPYRGCFVTLRNGQIAEVCMSD